MKKFISLLILILIISTVAYSQKKELSLEQAVQEQWRSLRPEHINGLTAYDKEAFSKVENYSRIVEISAKNAKEKELANLKEINNAMSEAGQKALQYFPFWDYSWLDKNILAFKNNGNFYLYNINDKKLNTVFELPENAENLDYEKKGNRTAFTIENNLYYMNENGKQIQVTDDEDKGIVNGDAYVHRQEFGIKEGIFWSPEGNYLAFYRKDERMVDNYPLVDIGLRIAGVNNIKYPMAGEKSEEVKLAIYNIKSKKTIFADVDDFTEERYLTSITWSPDEKHIYIGVLNRGQDHLKMNKYNAETGGFVKTLFEEKHEKYVEPEHPLIFLPEKSDEFLYFSERDGYNHLYLYDTEGKMKAQLTKGKWVVLDFYGFDSEGETIFFSATKESPIEKHVYSVNIKKGKIKKLTNDEGVHSAVFTNNFEYFVDSYSNTQTPNRVVINDYKGKEKHRLLTADNPLADYKLGEISLGTIKAADGKTDLYYRMITPPDFDPNKKYPVIVYVYGGPHAQLIRNSWLADVRLWQMYMAQKGYIMFTLDNRGSANRGLEFENVIHRYCGQAEMADQMKGIEFLKSKKFTDADRIGVHGWSYGGFMTTSLMLNYPEVFKVGVAGGPVIDWKYYEVMYGERYMDTPEENPKGYEKTSLLNKADKLEGRLLIIHGYQDPVVVPQHSIDFKRSVINADTDCDFFLYPESEHNVRGKKRSHLMRKVSRYFDDYL